MHVQGTLPVCLGFFMSDLNITLCISGMDQLREDMEFFLHVLSMFIDMQITETKLSAYIA